MEFLRRRGVETEISFPMIDKDNPENFLSGLTLSVQIYARDIGDSAGWVDITPSDVTINETAGGGYGLELGVTEMLYDLLQIIITDAASSPVGATLMIDVITYTNLFDQLLASTTAIEGALDVADMFKLLLAFVAGTTTGGGAVGDIVYKSQDGLTSRITMTVDANGNRSVTVVNGS